MIRAWDPDTFPPAECILTIMTLAAVPRGLATRLSAFLVGGITVGAGAVPDLPGFENLRNVDLPLQAGTWDRSPGVYDPARRRIGVGSAPSPSISVAAHELGHAVDDLDGHPSQSTFWISLHDLLASALIPPFQESVREWYAEAFACVLTRRARQLVRLMGDDESAAQQAYQWFARRYGIG
ncbi:hypothetical protein [Nonomuraea jabiensis]|uniref:hypothetical protein n=1 Tax=Nonomuraea jabiensis TaxID=882448 RepID=UPI003D75CC5E